MRIAIAGGTGTVGRQVVTAARAAGHEPIVLSRSTGVDLMTADGLASRLDGIDAVIDVSGTSSLSAKGAIRFFGTVTEHLLAAERAAGVAHHVALSIIGAAQANSGTTPARPFKNTGSWALAGPGRCCAPPNFTNSPPRPCTAAAWPDSTLCPPCAANPLPPPRLLPPSSASLPAIPWPWHPIWPGPASRTCLTSCAGT